MRRTNAKQPRATTPTRLGHVSAVARAHGCLRKAHQPPIVCVTVSNTESNFRTWDICPSTDPGILGGDTLDEGWTECGSDLEEFSCQDLGFSSPAGNVTNFYTPGNFPPNGTQDGVFNTGVVSSPVSGSTYTWTFQGDERVVTVQSADAEPTEAAGNNKDGDGDENDKDADNEDNGSLATPTLWLAGGFLILDIVMMSW